MPLHSPSIADAVASLNAAHGGTTTRAAGVAVNSQDTSNIAAALALADAADAIVLVLGITRAEEHEGAVVPCRPSCCHHAAVSLRGLVASLSCGCVGFPLPLHCTHRPEMAGIGA